MNPTERALSPASEEQAALWAARTDGATLSDADQKAFNLWLAENPRHPALLADYRRLSLALEQQIPALVAAGVVASPAAPVPATARPRWQPSWLLPTLAAAACALVAAIGVVRYRGAPVQRFTTSAGERRTVVLADGSRIDMNAGTEMTAQLSPTLRRVHMSGGEAYFVVAKDANRPFIVETQAASVRVTGTIFDLSSDAPAQLQVTVVEGSVQVQPSGSAAGSASPYTLKAGDQFTINGTAANPGHLESDNLDNLLAWRDGYVVFRKTLMSQALARFSRYDGQTLVADPSVAGIEVTGRYQLSKLDDFLASQEDSKPVSVIHERDGSIRVTASAQP